MERTSVLVRRALKSKQISDQAARTIEQRGDEAFREICEVLKEELLPDLVKINAMSLMAQISRHFYMEGKPQLIRLAAHLAKDPSEKVRARACHTAIFGLQLLENLKNLHPYVSKAQEDAREAVFSAMHAGLDTETQDMAERFIKQRGWSR